MKLIEATLEAQALIPPDVEGEESRHLCLERGCHYQEVRRVLKQWGYQWHIPPQEEGDLVIHS